MVTFLLLLFLIAVAWVSITGTWVIRLFSEFEEQPDEGGE